MALLEKSRLRATYALYSVASNLNRDYWEQVDHDVFAAENEVTKFAKIKAKLGDIVLRVSCSIDPRDITPVVEFWEALERRTEYHQEEHVFNEAWQGSPPDFPEQIE